MSHSRIHLVIAGSSNTDLVLNGPLLPRPGESVAGGRESEILHFVQNDNARFQRRQ